MNAGERASKLIDVSFLIASGRVNVDVEWRCMKVLRAESLSEFGRKLYSATEKQVERLWAIVKATPAGKELA